MHEDAIKVAESTRALDSCFRIGEPGAGYEAYVAELGDDWVEAVTRAGQRVSAIGP